MLSRRQLGLCAIASMLVGSAACSDKPTTVYVVRHAEKDDPGKMGDPKAAKDPDLSIAGEKRAATLPTALGETKLTAVFSSPYKRTRQTVAPAAKANGLEVQQIDADDVAGLVGRIKSLNKGSTVLVAGHSNTVPEIVKALGVNETINLEHGDYGDLFVVTLSEPAKLERRRFGG